MTLARTDSVGATLVAATPGRATRATNAGADSFSMLLGALISSRSTSTETATSPAAEPTRSSSGRDAADDPTPSEAHSPVRARPTNLSEHASDRAHERVTEVRGQQTGRDAERVDEIPTCAEDEAASTVDKSVSKGKRDDSSEPTADADVLPTPMTPAPMLTVPAPMPTVPVPMLTTPAQAQTAGAAAQVVAQAAVQAVAQTAAAVPQAVQPSAPDRQANQQVAAAAPQTVSQVSPTSPTTSPSVGTITAFTPGNPTQAQTDSQSQSDTDQQMPPRSFAALVAAPEAPTGSTRGASPAAAVVASAPSATLAQNALPAAAEMAIPESAVVTVAQSFAPATDTPSPAAVAHLTDNPAVVIAAQPVTVDASAADPTSDPAQRGVSSTRAVSDPIQSSQAPVSAAPAPAATSASPAQGTTPTSAVATQAAATQPVEASVAKADSPRADAKPIEAGSQPTNVPVTTASTQTRSVAPAAGPAQEPVTAARAISQIEKAIQTAPTSRPAEVRLQLHPEHLGRVDVVLATGQDGLAVTVTAHNAHTRALIDSMLPQLKEALQQQGVDVRQLTLSTSSQGSQPDAPDRGWQREPHGSGPTNHSDGWQHRDDREAPSSATARHSRSASLIDYAA